MKTSFVGIASILALGIGASAAFAQDDMDTDGDGVLSYAEMIIGYPDLTEETFVTIDANQDGTVDADELAAAKEAGLLPS